ncbi:MAG: dephospho-CoA kinase [Bacteroidetes bacterium]|nr:dephospho-CoA kinase [Bacteroidota bacterium]
MIKIALTGNLGSGKSTVAEIFSVLGVPVYHADQEAKKFLFQKEVVDQLVDTFGEDILTTDRTIDRKKLASIVFKNKAALEFLNGIIHPLVRKDLYQWMEENKQHAYVVQEAAILFESGFYRDFDKIIVVACPVEMAIQRVMLRDGVSESDVLSRMKNQWPQEEKIKRADFVIHNDGNRLVIPQVLEIHRTLSRK